MTRSACVAGQQDPHRGSGGHQGAGRHQGGAQGEHEGEVGHGGGLQSHGQRQPGAGSNQGETEIPLGPSDLLLSPQVCLPSAAHSAGLRAGNVITIVNDWNVEVRGHLSKEDGFNRIFTGHASSRGCSDGSHGWRILYEARLVK